MQYIDIYKDLIYYYHTPPSWILIIKKYIKVEIIWISPINSWNSNILRSVLKRNRGSYISFGMRLQVTSTYARVCMKTQSNSVKLMEMDN